MRGYTRYWGTSNAWARKVGSVSYLGTKGQELENTWRAQPAYSSIDQAALPPNFDSNMIGQMQMSA